MRTPDREPAVEASFKVRVPLDIAATLRNLEMWGASAWLRIDEHGAFYAQREASGPATVRIRATDGRVLASGWGPGADELVGRVPELLGLSGPGIEDVVPHHRFVARAQLSRCGLRVGRTGQVFPRLISAALAQKVTGRNSESALWRIARAFGEQAPGPRDDLFLLPPPRELAAQPYYAFHPLNVEKHRADLVKRIASRASALQRAANMAPAEARAHLEKLRGIGPWTSGIVCGGALGDADAVPLADLHLPRFVSWNLAGEPDGDDARMMELLQPYSGLRGLVARASKGGSAPPRKGPKMAVMEIRDR